MANHLEVIKDLGLPLPQINHSVSVSLPLWSHVVGYEEGDMKITSRMTNGYPRFRVHNSVVELVAKVKQLYCGESQQFPTEKEVIILPSYSVAIRFIHFLVNNITEHFFLVIV